MVLPSLCLLCQRWATLLPGSKKKGAASDGAEAGARAATREAIDAVVGSLTTLQAALKKPNQPYAACVQLDGAADEWTAFLGGSAQADDITVAVLRFSA